MNLLLSPHNDDEVLFAAFTIMRVKPLVVIAYDSVLQVQRGNDFAGVQERRQESLDGMTALGVEAPYFLGLSDENVDRDEMCAALLAMSARFGPFEQVFAPIVYPSSGNRHHDLVGEVARDMWSDKVVGYHTYCSLGKMSSDFPVSHEWWMVRKKLRAMSLYESQIRLADTRPHFTRDIWEYYDRSVD